VREIAPPRITFLAHIRPVSGAVIAQDVYEHINSSWFITREIWNFTQFNQPFLDCFFSNLLLRLQLTLRAYPVIPACLHVIHPTRFDNLFRSSARAALK
jgi:hypothetical protein